jgi:tripartite-type tricarboxylate transporter receptor subunit TctC
MIAFAKNHPPLIATSTVGSSEHMETIWFKEVCQLPGKITSTGGSRDTVGALLRGDADLTLIDYAAIKTLVDSGDVNPLVSMTEERIMPGVPTIREAGYPKCLEFIGGTLGRNLIGPPKMDPEAKRILIAAFKKMVADPEFQAYCKKTGNDLSPLYDKDQEAAMMKYYDAIMKNVQMFNKYGL